MKHLDAFFIAVIIITLLWVYVQLFSLYLLLNRQRRRDDKKGYSDYKPKVSILKPVREVDEEAYENFASFCRQNYPKYEIVFGVAEEDDPVIEVIGRLIKNFPNVPIKLVVSPKEVGPNPKVNNLENAYKVASGDVIIISDSDVRADENYISVAVAPLKEKKTGIVTAVAMMAGAKDFWSGVCALIFNGGLGSVFSVSHQLGLLNMTYGPSVAVRREVLEEMGGFPAIADKIGEDITMGQLVRRLGYKIVVQSRIVKIIKKTSNTTGELNHILRWLIIVKKHSPVLSYATPIFFAYPFALSYFVVRMDSLSLLLLLLAIFSIFMFMAVMSLRYVKDRNLLRYLPFIPFAALVFIPIWFCSLVRSKIVWRGISYKVLKKGCLKKLECRNTKTFIASDHRERSNPVFTAR